MITNINSIIVSNSLKQLTIFSVLVTNWATVTLTTPKIDPKDNQPSRESINREIGVISSNKIARVIVDTKTNDILISSEIISIDKSLVRDITNNKSTFYFTNDIVNFYYPKYKDATNLNNNTLKSSIIP